MHNDSYCYLLTAQPFCIWTVMQQCHSILYLECNATGSYNTVYGLHATVSYTAVYGLNATVSYNTVYGP